MLSKIDSSKMHPQWLNILSKTTIYSNLRVILLRKLSKIDSRKMHPQWLNILSKMKIDSNVWVILTQKVE
jgi:hypothetical protein